MSRRPPSPLPLPRPWSEVDLCTLDEIVRQAEEQAEAEGWPQMQAGVWIIAAEVLKRSPRACEARWERIGPSEKLRLRRKMRDQDTYRGAEAR